MLFASVFLRAFIDGKIVSVLDHALMNLGLDGCVWANSA